MRRGDNWGKRMAAMLTVVVVLATGWAPTKAQDSAVTLMYGRFAETATGQATSSADLDAHIALLTSGDYTVLPLLQIIAALQAGTPLPDRTIGITVDIAESSVYDLAWPRLKQAGLPFTLFVATDVVDSAGPGYANWDQIREMASAGVSIGSHGAGYRHLAGLGTVEVTAEVERANARFREELGLTPAVFAYPYGEYSLAAQAAILASGYEAAYGQQSGALWRGTDWFAMPRFAMTGRFAAAERFRVVVDTLALPASDIVPEDPVLRANPPPLGFTVPPDLPGLEALACYTASFGRVPVEQLGPSRMEVRFPAALPAGRPRVNCTVPAPQGRWRWLGFQFLVGE